jgi:hypothetical protein
MVWWSMMESNQRYCRVIAAYYHYTNRPNLASLIGFEPTTPGFVDQYSIQLSYSENLFGTPDRGRTCMIH